MRVRDSILVSFSGDEELFYRNGSSGQLKAYLVDNLRKRMFCVKSEFTISTFSLPSNVYGPTPAIIETEKRP